MQNKNTGGDPHLGGDDWDLLIMEHIIREHLGGRPKIVREGRGRCVCVRVCVHVCVCV